MMLTRLLTAGAAIAALGLAVPAAAQSAADDARFEQAQTRFQTELERFQQEFDRYQSLRGQGGDYRDQGDNRYQPPRVPYQGYDDNGGYNDDSGYNDERDEGSYDPSHYYRSGPQYQERVLAPSDRVYAGDDGRYYCRRNDGTTGLIVGGAAGGILGNVIDGGHSRIVGTLLGGAVGAVAGKSIDQNNSQVRCR